ncbi:glycosyltransferase family 4 protein [Alteromonadaceae bacterium BrNp21-10]|nr:glycosyltransferase family 4 protein [Alteromonadaceae bacterium BrNp21-10]
MKILIVTSNYPRWMGDTTTPFVHNFARELVKQNIQVRVLAPHYEGAQTKESMDGVEVRRFRYWLPLRGQTVCYQGGALGNLKKSPLNKLKLPILVLCELLALLKEVISYKPDWVNSHWLIPQGFVASIVCKLTGTKHIATVHGGDVFALNSNILLMFKRFVINTADKVTVNSSVTEAKVKKIAPMTSTPIVRIPTGILPAPKCSIENVQLLRQSLQQTADEKLILFVGRLSEEKGVGDAIKALKIVRDKELHARLIIVGEGHDKATFIALTQSLKLNEYVNFIGWVDSKEIYPYFRACDVFVGPSKQAESGWIEAQGLTFVEAMLAGCPVIGSNSGGIPDAVQNGKTGWLVEPNNPVALQNAISLVLTSSQSELEQITHYAQKFAEDNYIISNVVNTFISNTFQRTNEGAK